jgi:hypothetical protein
MEPSGLPVNLGANVWSRIRSPPLVPMHGKVRADRAFLDAAVEVAVGAID